jgi:hypothetical protein
MRTGWRTVLLWLAGVFSLWCGEGQDEPVACPEELCPPVEVRTPDGGTPGTASNTAHRVHRPYWLEGDWGHAEPRIEGQGPGGDFGD